MGESKVWRLGFTAGVVCRTYVRAEFWVFRWLERKGLPKRVCKPVALVIRTSLVAALIYASYGLIFAVLILFATRRHLENPSPVQDSEFEGLDSDALFPDPYSAKYMNDPAFHDD